MNNVACAACKYAKEKQTKSNWKPIACSKHESEYYGSWLNTSEDGRRLDHIVWAGCPMGEGEDNA